jgi:asparagine synthase (glutamine-hydrolysing)
MAASVEARVPFLDHEVVEFVAAVPPQYKMKGLMEKALLRQSARGLLPEPARSRQKRPFYTPIKGWFFGGSEPEFASELLGDLALRSAGFFAPDLVKQMREDLELAPDHHLRRSQLEWALILVLGVQLLHREFVQDFDPLRAGRLRMNWQA